MLSAVFRRDIRKVFVDPPYMEDQRKLSVLFPANYVILSLSASIWDEKPKVSVFSSKQYEEMVFSEIFWEY